MNMEMLEEDTHNWKEVRYLSYFSYPIISKAYHMLHFTTSLDRQMLAATLHTHSAYLTHSQFVDDLLPV